MLALIGTIYIVGVIVLVLGLAILSGIHDRVDNNDFATLDEIVEDAKPCLLGIFGWPFFAFYLISHGITELYLTSTK